MTNRLLDFLEIQARDCPSMHIYFSKQNTISTIISYLDQYSVEHAIRAIYLIGKYNLFSHENTIMTWFDPGTYKYTQIKYTKRLVRGNLIYFELNDDVKSSLAQKYDSNTELEDAILKNNIVQNCFNISTSLKWPNPNEFNPEGFILNDQVLVYKYFYKYILYPINRRDNILMEYFS